MALKKSENKKPAQAAVPYIAIPKPWLIAILGVLILPWLIVTAVWLKSNGFASREGTADVTHASKGRWGELTLIPIVISPPMELVFTDWGFMHRPAWFFPGVNADAAIRILQTAGVSAADAASLRQKSQFEPRINGVIVMPDPSWVRTLTPQTRAGIYNMLAKNELNSDQMQAFRFRGSNPDSWIGAGRVSARTKQLVEPLIYRDGTYMLFSDIELIRPEIGSEEELRRLGKALFRQPTVIAHLAVPKNEDLAALVEYWGRGGRRTDIRPLLESVSEEGPDQTIDIHYLLPPFAQQHLYTYPKLSAGDLDRPSVVNCLWTVLNFFNQEPNDRFLDGDTALRTLKEDYFVVEGDFELGDIVAFLDEQGDLFHAAVYIADDLLFTKNGLSAMAPWTLASMEDVKGYYKWRSENPRILFHRRKDF
jgi:hypothetical protein